MMTSLAKYADDDLRERDEVGSVVLGLFALIRLERDADHVSIGFRAEEAASGLIHCAPNDGALVHRNVATMNAAHFMAPPDALGRYRSPRLFNRSAAYCTAYAWAFSTPAGTWTHSPSASSYSYSTCSRAASSDGCQVSPPYSPSTV